MFDPMYLFTVVVVLTQYYPFVSSATKGRGTPLLLCFERTLQFITVFSLYRRVRRTFFPSVWFFYLVTRLDI